MVKKSVAIVGIEVRHSVDPKTKVGSDRYYVHGSTSDGKYISGTGTFCAKCPDDILHLVEVGETYDLVYRSYNGYNTLEAVYDVR